MNALQLANCNPQCVLDLCDVAFSIFFISGSFLQLYTPIWVALLIGYLLPPGYSASYTQNTHTTST